MMVYPEQTTNFFRGKGVRDNDEVLRRFVAAGNQQGALDYWGLKGEYAHGDAIFKGGGEPGVVDPKTGEIYYQQNAFNDGFDKLYFVADHEERHQANVRSGKYNDVKLTDEVLGAEEFNAYEYNYKRQGLYRNHKMDIGPRLNNSGTNAGVNFNIILSYTFYKPWWHIIYRIPRKW